MGRALVCEEERDTVQLGKGGNSVEDYSDMLLSIIIGHSSWSLLLYWEGGAIERIELIPLHLPDGSTFAKIGDALKEKSRYRTYRAHLCTNMFP